MCYADMVYYVKEITDGRFEGNRSRGRKRIGVLNSLLKGVNFEIMKREHMTGQLGAIGLQGPACRQSTR